MRADNSVLLRGRYHFFTGGKGCTAGDRVQLVDHVQEGHDHVDVFADVGQVESQAAVGQLGHVDAVLHDLGPEAAHDAVRALGQEVALELVDVFGGHRGGEVLDLEAHVAVAEPLDQHVACAGGAGRALDGVAIAAGQRAREHVEQELLAVGALCGRGAGARDAGGEQLLGQVGDVSGALGGGDGVSGRGAAQGVELGADGRDAGGDGRDGGVDLRAEEGGKRFAARPRRWTGWRSPARGKGRR